MARYRLLRLLWGEALDEDLDACPLEASDEDLVTCPLLNEFMERRKS